MGASQDDSENVITQAALTRSTFQGSSPLDYPQLFVFMFLPRYQPVRKRSRVESTLGASFNSNLDDYCLSRIIYHTLRLASGDNDSDNGTTERSLSLVSKRWYLLTQAQINLCGVHRIDLDRILTKSVQTQTKKTVGSGIAYVPQARRPGVLMPRNHVQQQILTTKPVSNTYDIALLRAIQPKLLKYKHILIDGSLTCDEFRKLIIALDSARVEQLRLNVKIGKDSTPAREFSVLPKYLQYLERLTLLWTNDSKNDFSNALTWTIYERATGLKTLNIYLEDSIDSGEISKKEPIEKISDRYMNRDHSFDRFQRNQHRDLARVTFKRTVEDSSSDCVYTSLIYSVLAHEDSISQVETNDNKLAGYIIRSSERTCTTLDFRLLRLLSPVKDMASLERLFQSDRLGSDLLAVVVNDVDQLAEIRKCLEIFKPARHDQSMCQLSLHLKDQKVSDSEDRIKSIIQLSHLCDLIVYIGAQQRVSIDCCHLMWSVGRALRADEMCMFKITLQGGNPLKVNQTTNDMNYSEITVPFGRYQHIKINSIREDMVKHREIIKSLKRDCYHQFVKSIRDNV